MINTFTILGKSLRQNLVFKLYKHYVIDSLLIVRKSGLKELIRQRGRKFIVAVFAYYLIRDSVVYVIIPFCIAKGLL